MKIRNGFVSNSSSSSYIIICNNFEGKEYDVELPVDDNGIYWIGKEGETCFGWGPDTIYNTCSKVNFAFLQAFYMDKNKDKERFLNTMFNREDTHPWLKMLEEVLLERPEVKEVQTLIPDKYNSYIDHQSASYEGVNIEMFDDKDRLKDFLFNPDSCIELDNDNKW